MIALLSRGWPVFLAAVVGNAVVQGAAVAPFATPSTSPAFVALTLVSLLACVVTLGLVVAALRAAVAGERRLRLRWTDVAASLAVVLAVSFAGLVSSWLVTPAVAVALIVLAGVVVGRGAAGFAAFGRAPVRAVALTLFTLLIVGVLWLGALLLGFFVTGWPAAGLTWLAIGVLGVLLLCAWTVLVRRAGERSSAAVAEKRIARPAGVATARESAGTNRTSQRRPRR